MKKDNTNTVERNNTNIVNEDNNENRYFFDFSIGIRIATIATIAIITLCLMLNHYEYIPQINDTIIEKEYLPTEGLSNATCQKILKAYQQNLKLNNADYKNIIKQIKNKINSFNPDISSVVNELASHKGAVRMSYLIAKDKLTGSNDTNEFISQTIEKYILVDTISMYKRVELLLEQFASELNTNRKTTLKQLSHSLSGELDQLYEMMDNRIAKLTNNLQKISFNTTLADINLIITAPLYKSIYKQAKKILKVVINRFMQTHSVAVTTSIADGPLPYLDIAAIAIEVFGVGWATWEIYEAQKIMKPAIEDEIRKTIKQFKDRLSNSSLKTAGDMLKTANSNISGN